MLLVPAACSARRARWSGSLSARSFSSADAFMIGAQPSNTSSTKPDVEREAGLHVDRHRQPDHLAAAGRGPVADFELGEAGVEVGRRRLDDVPVQRPPARSPTS